VVPQPLAICVFILDLTGAAVNRLLPLILVCFAATCLVPVQPPACIADDAPKAEKHLVFAMVRNGQGKDYRKCRTEVLSLLRTWIDE
jgi:hypothetical protein